MIDWIISWFELLIFSGENYSGDIQRVTLKALLDGSQTRDYNWMVKLPPKDPSTMAMTQAFNLEGKEFGMYRDFLPGIRYFSCQLKLYSYSKYNFFGCIFIPGN